MLTGADGVELEEDFKSFVTGEDLPSVAFWTESGAAVTGEGVFTFLEADGFLKKLNNPPFVGETAAPSSALGIFFFVLCTLEATCLLAPSGDTRSTMVFFLTPVIGADGLVDFCAVEDEAGGEAAGAVLGSFMMKSCF